MSLNPNSLDVNTTTPTLLRSICSILRDWFNNGLSFAVGALAPQWTPVVGYTITGSGIAAISYVSGTGTAGTDNTAQTVASVTLPAGALNKIGQGIRIRVLYEISAATPIVVALTLNGVTIDTKSTAVTTPERFQADVMYVDGTHANFSGDFDTGGIGTDAWTVGAIGINTAGFAHASDQVLAVTQTKVAATHITVYEIRVEQIG